jgi:hypothetical protein
MTKNGLDIQTKSTKRTDFQSDRFLLLGRVIQKKEKTLPSHFLKFLLANRTNGKFFVNAQGNNSYFVPLVNNIL